MKKILIFALMLMVLSVSAAAVDYTMNVTSTNSNQKDAYFVAKALKYDPYPVNPGNWFDIWIKVENTGQNDAPDAVFRLIPEYPFTAEGNLTQEYGTVDGTINAIKNRLPDETASQSNQVVLKYRVRVADNAPEGVSILKFSASTDGRVRYVYNLPITIKKTSTDFSVSFQDYNHGRAIFLISNIGDKAASGVTVSIPESEKKVADGQTQMTIGNLQPGDFTTVSFDMKENITLNKFALDVAYTDEAGNRVTLEMAPAVSIKPVTEETTENITGIKTIYDSKYTYWVFGLIGLAVGIIISLIFSIRRNKD